MRSGLLGEWCDHFGGSLCDQLLCVGVTSSGCLATLRRCDQFTLRILRLCDQFGRIPVQSVSYSAVV